MDSEKLNEALEVAKSAVVEIGHELKQHYGNIESQSKSSSGITSIDIVTRLDREAEDFLAKKFSEFDPSIAFWGEEAGVRSDSETTWIVDPIDGTNHFVRGLPFCTTMVALIENGQVNLSIINDFVNDNLYWAVRGKGAYRNSERISVSDTPLENATLSVETKLDKPENMDMYLRVRKRCGTIIQTINCGFEFSMLASGKIDGRLVQDGYGFAWDYAPGSLLVTEAGGVATNIGKSSYDYNDYNYVIGNKLVHEALTQGADAIFPVS